MRDVFTKPSKIRKSAFAGSPCAERAALSADLTGRADLHIDAINTSIGTPAVLSSMSNAPAIFSTFYAQAMSVLRLARPGGSRANFSGSTGTRLSAVLRRV